MKELDLIRQELSLIKLEAERRRDRFVAEHGNAGMNIIISFGAVLMALYIIIVVVGKLGTTAATLHTDVNWSNVSYNYDVAARGAVSMSQIIPIAIIGIGVLALIIGSLIQPD